MSKRIFTEEQKVNRANTSRLWREKKKQSQEWREQEAKRKRDSYVPKDEKSRPDLKKYNEYYKNYMKKRRAMKRAQRNLELLEEERRQNIAQVQEGT